MPIIPVADYRPDAPAYLGQHATVMSGVFHREDGSVGPLRAPATVATVSGSRPVSAYMARKGDGSVFLYAAMEFNPFIIVKAATTFTGFYTSPNSYPTLMYPWRFAQFGDSVFFSSLTGGLWCHELGSSSLCAQITGAPSGTHIATIEPGFLMLGHLNDATGERPSSLRWSAINDATDWPLIGTTDAASKQSDEQQLPNGGRITGILSSVGGAAGVVLTERSVYRMEYVGAPIVFAFREIARGVGNVCPNASIVVDGRAYFISDSGFQRFDGESVVPFGQGRVSATFLAELDREHLHRVYVAHDPLKKVLVWAYPDLNSTSGNPNKWLVYNYAIDKWADANDPALTMTLIFSARTDRIPMESLGTYFDPPDSLTISLDSATVNGGAPLLGGFNTSFDYVQFTGATLPALVETGETDAAGDRVFVRGIRPLTDAANATAAVGHRNAFSSAITYTPLTAMAATGECPQRISGRYARARVYIPPAATWTYLQGADVRLMPRGRR
jgi:hypothetical protein